MTIPGRTGAMLARGRSIQTYETPNDFMAAVEARWGPMDFDLAADRSNTKAKKWYGPGSAIAEDAFTQDWTKLKRNLWLNPPFGDIAPWAERCAISAEYPQTARRIFLLTPASVGANWFADFVHQKAMVYGLVGRLTFVGCDQAYPKDCCLSVFGVKPGFDVWRWRQ